MFFFFNDAGGIILNLLEVLLFDYFLVEYDIGRLVLEFVGRPIDVKELLLKQQIFAGRGRCRHYSFHVFVGHFFVFIVD